MILPIVLLYWRRRQGEKRFFSLSTGNTSYSAACLLRTTALETAGAGFVAICADDVVVGRAAAAGRARGGFHLVLGVLVHNAGVRWKFSVGIVWCGGWWRRHGVVWGWWGAGAVGVRVVGWGWSWVVGWGWSWVAGWVHGGYCWFAWEELRSRGLIYIWLYIFISVWVE